MKPQDKEFDGSCSLFKTHQLLQYVAGNDIWLTQFKLISLDHINVIELLLKTLCALGICFDISGTFPAYMAGVFSSYFAVTLCIAKTSSTILVPLLKRNGNLMIGPFMFTLSGEEHTDDDDFLYYEISYEDISIPFHIIVIHATRECYPESNLNFVEFIWKYLAVVKFKMSAIFVVPFTTPKMFS